LAFYEDKREHDGGALVLFKRNLTVAVPNAKTHRRANWYMRLKIGGRKGYVTRSTKLTIYEDAYEYAKSELLRLQQAAVRLEVLRLMATIIADEARDIEGVKVKAAKASKPLPALPIPKSANAPKPTQAVPTQQVSQQYFEPIQAIKPIVPK
jgi:hypothetical protein